MIGSRCTVCERRSDHCKWPRVGCVGTGEVFRYRFREYRRIGPMMSGIGERSVLKWPIDKLPDAVTGEITQRHQNSIIVQRKEDGCICHMDCSLDLDDKPVYDWCEGCQYINNSSDSNDAKCNTGLTDGEGI